MTFSTGAVDLPEEQYQRESGDLYCHGLEKKASLDEDALLETLLEVEGLLCADLQRKPKHQKQTMQATWRQQIRDITAQLALDE